MRTLDRKSICVFCGSRSGADPDFAATAEQLGQALAADGLRLVYGAGDVGLMGILARAAGAAGRDLRCRARASGAP